VYSVHCIFAVLLIDHPCGVCHLLALWLTFCCRLPFCDFVATHVSFCDFAAILHPPHVHPIYFDPIYPYVCQITGTRRWQSSRSALRLNRGMCRCYCTLLLLLPTATADCYCTLLLPTATAHCYCPLLLPTATAHCYCTLLLPVTIAV
jgi:hypothetical protein